VGSSRNRSHLQPCHRFSRQRSKPGWPCPLLLLLEVALGLAVAVTVLWLVLRALRWYRQRETQQAVEEVHESTWSAQLALHQLGAALRRLRPRRGRARRLEAARLGHTPRSVREAYRYALALLAQRGLPRQADETPLQYLPRVAETWPDAVQPLDDLTGRYLVARYGDLASADDLAPAQAAWAELRRLLADGTSE